MNFHEAANMGKRNAKPVQEQVVSHEQVLQQISSMSNDTVADAVKWALAEIKKANDSKAFTYQWYAERWERLRELIHDNALHIEDEACCIMANGTASAGEPPTYAQQMNGLRHEFDVLRKENAALKAELAAARGA